MKQFWKYNYVAIYVPYSGTVKFIVFVDFTACNLENEFLKILLQYTNTMI